MAADSSLLVEGRIILEDAPPFSGATAYVRMEDVSRADAPSRVISEQILRNVSYSPQQNGIAFVLHGMMPTPSGRYTISVHIDLNNNGKIDPGDYITMESFPVLTGGRPNKAIQIRARRIK